MPGIQCVQTDIPPPLQIHNSRSADVFYLGPLPQGSNYMIPQKNSSTLKCDCSTVVYRYRAYFTGYCERALIREPSSLFMACTACQNCPIQQWTYWSQFCTQVYVAEYLEAIPLNTAIPHWAFRSYGVRARCQ